MSCNNPKEFGYYSAKYILENDGTLKLCPGCGAEKIEYEKKKTKTDKWMFAWGCSDCGFRFGAVVLPNLKFSLKSNLMEATAKQLDDRDAFLRYFERLGIKPTRDELKKCFPSEEPPAVVVNNKKRKTPPTPVQSSDEEEEEEGENEEQQPQKKLKLLSESGENSIIQILEHVKVIKDINEVQKDELKELLVATKALSYNALEMCTKVVSLLTENTLKLNNLTPPVPSTPPLSQLHQQNDEFELSSQEVKDIEDLFNLTNMPAPQIRAPPQKKSTVSSSSSNNNNKRKNNNH